MRLGKLILLLPLFFGCSTFVPKFKYHLAKMPPIKQYYIYKGQCVENKIKISEDGDFLGFDEENVPYYQCLDQLLVCYPDESQAEVEGFIKTIFRQYLDF